MSIGSLIMGTMLSPPSMEHVFPFIIIGVFIALLEFFPLDLLSYRYSFVHIIIFSGAVLYGTGLAAWAALCGIVLAVGLQIILPKALKSNFSTIEPSAKIGLFEVGLNLTPLILAFSIFGIATGIRSIEIGINQNWLAILTAGIIFGILHGSFYLLGSRFLSKPKNPRASWDVLALISIEILPVFLGFTTLLTYALMGDSVLIILGVSTFALVLLIHYLSEPRRNLSSPNNVMVSRLKVENVVKDPKNPSIRKRRTSGVMISRLSKKVDKAPMRTHPMILTDRVLK